MNMKNQLRDIKEFTTFWKESIRDEIATLDKEPKLTIIQIGNIEESNRYVRNKIRDCDSVGIKTKLIRYDNSITQDELITNVLKEQLNCDAIFVQLPLPEHLSIKEISKYIFPYNDVDGFSLNSPFTPCTSLGIMKYLNYCHFDLTGKNAVIIGRSDIVGKPLAKIMTDANATVTLCHSKTKNLNKYLNIADLIVCAVGKTNFLNCYPIYVPIIDVGINFNEDGKLVGDCFNTKDRNVTPVPGGVGLLTRCALLENVVKATKNNIQEDK